MGKPFRLPLFTGKIQEPMFNSPKGHLGLSVIEDHYVYTVQSIESEQALISKPLAQRMPAEIHFSP